jgi:hypothetical protein
VTVSLKILAASAAAAVALLVVLIVQPGAWAGSDSRQAAALLLTSSEPGASSGWTFEVDYVNPIDPEGKPPAVRRVVTQLAPGAGFDTSVPARCAASDAELMAQGVAACPADSKVGEGYIRIDTGLAEPGRFIEADVTFLNAATEVIFLSTERQSGSRVVTRSTIEGGRTISMAPLLPGTPPDGAAIDIARVHLVAVSRKVDGEVRSYVSTPPGCPASGVWANSIEFTYADGASQTVDSPSPCSVAAGHCENVIAGSSAGEELVGSTGSDSIAAGGGDDLARGRPGDDCLTGGAGRDVIRGGAGGDVLAGGSGGDRVRSVDGARDRVRCGAGRDRVAADGRDVVADSCEIVA